MNTKPDWFEGMPPRNAEEPFWGNPECERQRMLNRINALERALREILFVRKPGGPIPKLVDGTIIERIENIAKTAIERAA